MPLNFHPTDSVREDKAWVWGGGGAEPRDWGFYSSKGEGDGKRGHSGIRIPILSRVGQLREGEVPRIPASESGGSLLTQHNLSPFSRGILTWGMWMLVRVVQALTPCLLSLPLGNCALYQRGGWWYHACAHSNLNGVWHLGGHYRSRYQDGVYWAEFRGGAYSLKKVAMLIRPL